MLVENICECCKRDKEAYQDYHRHHWTYTCSRWIEAWLNSRLKIIIVTLHMFTVLERANGTNCWIINLNKPFQ